MDKKLIFKNNVKRIIIENYNICNRKCYMCPQALGVRKKGFEKFSSDLFNKLMNELSLIDYSNTIAIGRYHEPFLFLDITMERCKSIRQFLPHANILINTNGDFVSKEILDSFSRIGINEIKIMRYQDEKYSDLLAEKMCLDLIRELGLKVINKYFSENEIIKYTLEPIGTMNIIIKSENYHNPSRGCDRGG